MVIGLIQTRPQAFPLPIRRKGRRSKLQIDVFRCVGSASSCQMRTAPHGRAQARGSTPTPQSFLTVYLARYVANYQGPYITLPPLSVSHRLVLPRPRASIRTHRQFVDGAQHMRTQTLPSSDNKRQLSRKWFPAGERDMRKKWRQTGSDP
jgi:hypothetical protein